VRLQRICDSNERGDGQVLDSSLDSLKILDVDVEFRAELVLCHPATGSQFRDPPSEIAEHGTDVGAAHPDGLRKSGAVKPIPTGARFC
jgi:hypothetical protein